MSVEFRATFICDGSKSVDSAAERLQATVDLVDGRANDEIANGITSQFDVGERAHDVDAAVGDDDAGARDVLDGEFGTTVSTADTTDGTRKRIALEKLDIFDGERVEIEIVETKQRHGIVNVKTKRESTNEIGSFLNQTNIFSEFAGLRKEQQVSSRSISWRASNALSTQQH